MRAALLSCAGRLALMLALSGLGLPAYAADRFILKLGNVQPPGAIVQEGLRYMAERVRERSRGVIEIQVVPPSQLRSEQEILVSVRLGTLDMYEGSAASVSRFLPRLQALACPFLWLSTDSMAEVVRGPIGEELAGELLQKRGMRILDLGWVFGVRHLTTTRTPAKMPEDLKGLKIRVQPDPIYLATVRAMGAIPIPVDAGEVYTALQTGVVDGQENPISNIWQRRFHEVQEYLMLTGHITQNQVVLINEARFQNFTPDQQRLLVEAAREAGDYQNGLIAKAEAADLEKLKAAGMQVIEPDVAAFRKAAGGVCRDPAVEEKIGKGFYDRIDAAQR